MLQFRLFLRGGELYQLCFQFVKRKKRPPNPNTYQLSLVEKSNSFVSILALQPKFSQRWIWTTTVVSQVSKKSVQCSGFSTNFAGLLSIVSGSQYSFKLSCSNIFLHYASITVKQIVFWDVLNSIDRRYFGVSTVCFR